MPKNMNVGNSKNDAKEYKTVESSDETEAKVKEKLSDVGEKRRRCGKRYC